MGNRYLLELIKELEEEVNSLKNLNHHLDEFFGELDQIEGVHKNKTALWVASALSTTQRAITALNELSTHIKEEANG